MKRPIFSTCDLLKRTAGLAMVLMVLATPAVADESTGAGESAEAGDSAVADESAATGESAEAGDSAVAGESADAEVPHMPDGLIPLPDYTGDFWHRGYVTGDWGGTRTEWANKGIQFGINNTNIFQSVTDGGVDRNSEFGGGIDWTMKLDLHRMGVLPGAMVNFRAETRYGSSVNLDSGIIVPVNTDAIFPLTRTADEDIALTITELSYVQLLSEHLGVTLGKFNTFGSTNEFAGGRGQTQFMNGNMVFSPVAATTVPYSTLGAGIIVAPAPELIISSLIMNTRDSSTTTGFEDIGEGWTWLTAAQYQYKLGDMPGGVNGAFTYARDSDFLDIGGGLVFTPGVGLSPATKSESWSVFVDAWQYVWVEEGREGMIDVTNGWQDLQGIGVFARLGFADTSTNPLESSFAFGIAAHGLIPSRDNDTMGLAYAYNSLQSSRFTSASGIESSSEVIEAYYSIAVTPAVNLSFDLQYVNSALSSADDAMILGLRLNMEF